MTVAIRQLREVCEITMGQAPDGASYNDNGLGLPLIAGAGDFGPHHPQAKKFTSAPTKICANGDIVLSIRATIGTKVLSDGCFCLGRGVAGLRPKDTLDTRYLWHWLGSAEGALAAKGRGATFPQVSRNDLAELEIPLPPLDEQRRIAAILDKADALRRKRKRAIGLLNGLTQSIFLEMFGDPIEDPRYSTRRLGEFVDHDRGISYGIVQRGDDQETGTKVLRISDIVDGHITGLGLKLTAPEIADKFRRTKLVGGEIVISITLRVRSAASTSVTSWSF